MKRFINSIICFFKNRKMKHLKTIHDEFRFVDKNDKPTDEYSVSYFINGNGERKVVVHYKRSCTNPKYHPHYAKVVEPWSMGCDDHYWMKYHKYVCDEKGNIILKPVHAGKKKEPTKKEGNVVYLNSK